MTGWTVTMSEAALERYDALPPVPMTSLRGLWRGSGVPTGHPLDGVLEHLGWFGKRFDDEDRVHPLVFSTPHGLRSVNPARIPLSVVLRTAPLLPTAPAARVFRMGRPLMTTRRPRGRLRDVRYRGVLSAALVYDDLPVIDSFRAVDDDTVLGAMDARGMAQPYLFRLDRVGFSASAEARRHQGATSDRQGFEHSAP